MTDRITTEEGLDLARALDESLAALVQIDALLEVAKGERNLDASLIAAITELGWHAIALPEEHGGLGIAAGDAMRLAAVGGRRLVPPALRDEAFGLAPGLAALAGRSDGAAARLEALLAGELRGGSLVQPDPTIPAAFGFLAPGATAAAVHFADGFAVVDADAAQRADGLDVGQGLARLELDGLEPELSGPAARTLRRTFLLALACDAFGAADAALEESIAYAEERQQFGKPIATFQAVAHLLAEMRLQIDVARSGISRLLTAGEGPEGERLAAAIAHTVPACARDVVEGAIQVHGGIGFSWELGMHLRYRRVLSAQYLLGGEAASAMAVGDLYFESRRSK